MKLEGKPTMAVLTRALNEHLEVCEKQGAATNRRLGRIEALIWTVAMTFIAQLLGACAYLFHKAYG